MSFRSSSTTQTNGSRRPSCSTSTTSTPPLKNSKARYIAGEAAAYAHTWSVIAEHLRCDQSARASPNDAGLGQRRPPTERHVRDGRSGRVPRSRMGPHCAREHPHRGCPSTERTRSRCHPCGAWRRRRRASTPSGATISIVTVDGDLIDRCEMFDQADLDAALARFAELHPQTPRLRNTASQVGQRYRAHFAAGDWDAMAEP